MSSESERVSCNAASTAPSSTRPAAGEAAAGSTLRMIWPALSETKSDASRAFASMLAPAVESSVMLTPATVAPDLIVSVGVVSLVSTPVRIVCAPLSLVTRSSTPSPLPGFAASPRKIVSARPPASLPVCRISAPASIVSVLFAARIISGLRSGEPALSKVMLFVVTVTRAPSAVKSRKPPMSRLSAPNLLSRVESSTIWFAAGTTFDPATRMSADVLAMSMRPS